MANIAYSDLLEGIRGHIGSSVFTRARSGPTVKRRNSPSRRPIALRPPRRTTFTYYATTWLSILTQDQRDAWNALAASTTFYNSLLHAYSPTGQQLYIRSNALLTLTNLAPISDPPDYAILAAAGLHPVYHKPNGIILDPPNTWPEENTRKAIISSSPLLPLSADTYYKNFTNATAYPANWPPYTYPVIYPGAATLLNRRLHFRARALDELGAASLFLEGAVSCLDNGPLALWYPMNDNEANNIVHDYLGTWNAWLSDPGGTPTTAFHSCTGPRGTGLNFDGIDDQVVRAQKNWTAGDTTISFWLRVPTLPGANSYVIEHYNVVTSGFRLYVKSPNPQLLLGISNGTAIIWFNWSNAGELESGRWHKLTLTTDLNDTLTYVDGVKTGQLLATHVVPWSATYALFFGNPGYGTNTPLQICDFRIYNRILAPTEIALI